MSLKSVLGNQYLYFIFVFDISFCISDKVVGYKNNDSLIFSFIVEYIDSLLGSLIIYLAIFGPILLK